MVHSKVWCDPHWRADQNYSNGRVRTDDEQQELGDPSDACHPALKES
jgi:hypothetical protein